MRFWKLLIVEAFQNKRSLFSGLDTLLLEHRPDRFRHPVFARLATAEKEDRAALGRQMDSA